MSSFFLGASAVLLCYTLIILDLKRELGGSGEYEINEKKAKVSRGFFAVWLVAAVFWGGQFATIRVPGLFDMTIERLLFIPLIFTLLLKLFRGHWQGQGDLFTEFWLGLFLIFCLLSMLLHGFYPIRPSLPSPWFLFVSGYALPSIVYLYVKNELVTIKDIESIVLVIFGIGLYLSIISYFEFFGLREYVYPKYINDPKVWLHLDRARGPFLNAGINGIMILEGILCGTYVYLYQERYRWFLGTALMVMIPSIYFSQTRSVYLSFIFCLVGSGLFLRTEIPKWKIFSLPLAVFLIFGLATAPRLASTDRRAGGVMQLDEVNVRLVLMRRSLEMIAEKPFQGHGFGQFLQASTERFRGRYAIPGTAEEQVQHNHLLGLWAELGILGITAYVLVVLRGLVRGLRVGLSKTLDNRISNLGLLVLLGMCAYVLNNMFLEPSYFLAYNGAFFVLLAIAHNLQTLHYDRPKSFAGHQQLPLPL